jgi:hypothetical protein
MKIKISERHFHKRGEDILPPLGYTLIEDVSSSPVLYILSAHL